MLKIAFLGGKGGITKTALARATGTQALKRGFTVVGFDTDGEQASFIRWNQRRKNRADKPATFPVVSCTVATTIEKQANESAFDIGIIDGAAYASRFVVNIAQIVDLVVIPTRYSVDDLESAVRVHQQLVEAGIPAQRLALAFSGVAESVKEHAAAESTLEELGIYAIPGYIPQMTSYSTAQDDGLSLCEVPNQARLFTMARWLVNGIIDRALAVKEIK